MSDHENLRDINYLNVELLRQIQLSLEEQKKDLTDVRERIIRLETHGYSERITTLEKEVQNLQARVIVLETQGKFFTAGIAAIVSAIVAFGSKWFTHA